MGRSVMDKRILRKYGRNICKQRYDNEIYTERDYRSGLSAAENRGIAIGEERGRTEAKLEAARNLINLGVSLDIIAQAQELPLETVQKLAEELKQKLN